MDYGAGNIHSVARALSAVGAVPHVTSDPDTIYRAEVVVFPGVGATRDTMDALHRLELTQVVPAVVRRGTPLLAICVGMQVLLETSEEFGDHPCLSVVGGRVRRLPGGQKVPQIGWNSLSFENGAADHPLFADVPEQSDLYFVHSYYCDLTDPAIVAARTDYGLNFPAALIRENLAAVQFHPEKSGRHGLQILTNFARWAAQS